jgi:curved DNA-binding protein
MDFGGDAGGFSDFFRTIFGGFSGGARSASMEDMFFGGGTGRGRDQEMVLELSLEELRKGDTKTVSCERTEPGPDGRLRKGRKTVNVNLPGGVTDGSRIRLKGQGSGGGDLFLVLRIAPHPRFAVEGHDIATVLKVSPWEAALGASLPVDTPFGSVTMKLPRGTQAGRKLRLKGKGLPRRKGALPGDLLVRVEMVIPEKLTDRERELLETLARESSFNPRG